MEVVYQYTAHIRSRGEEQRELDKDSGERPRRWVVERTHSWLNRVRAVLIRWEKKIQNHIATLDLVCAYDTLRRADVLGEALSWRSQESNMQRGTSAVLS